MKTYTVSEAKRSLGALADEALRGEVVVIVRKTRRLVLRELPEMEPVPARPEGFFEDCYTKEEAALDNRLAKGSIQGIVK